MDLRGIYRALFGKRPPVFSAQSQSIRVISGLSRPQTGALVELVAHVSPAGCVPGAIRSVMASRESRLAKVVR